MYQRQQEERRHFHTIVIGAGQAGLATGYYLKQQHKDFLIIDGASEIGHSWQSRWDSLTLHTPDWANSLPGLAFPGSIGKYPNKDEMAQYLRDYASHFQLPVRLDTKVQRLYKAFDSYCINTGDEQFTCRNVVIATGSYAQPRIPSLAADISKDILQVHSSSYRNPAQLPAGPILVVGAATSGLQIALDIAASGRKTYIAGTPPGKIPDFALRFFPRFFLWVNKNVLTVKTRPGRKVEYKIKKQGAAAPLIHISLEKVLQKGVQHLPRLEETREGYPLFRNAATPDLKGPLQVDGIVWCTGFTSDFSWIDLENIVDEQGYPQSDLGVSPYYEGLYFMGMMFQYALSSIMVNGVGRDAKFITDHIRKNSSHAAIHI